MSIIFEEIVILFVVPAYPELPINANAIEVTPIVIVAGVLQIYC